MQKHITAAFIAAALLMVNFCVAAPLSGAQVLLTEASQDVTNASTVKVELVADTTAVEPGKTFRIGALFTLEEGWHIYYKQPGDTGFPTDVKLTLPEGYTVVAVEWEKPKRFDENGFTTYGYTGKTTISIVVKAPDNIPPGTNVKIDAQVQYLVCKDSCVPGNADVSITLPVSDGSTAAQAANADKFAHVGFTGDVTKIGARPSGSVLDHDFGLSGKDNPKHSLLVYLLFAFIGGVVLNCMPCVLPVLSLKIMRFVKESGEERGKIVRLGFAYALGTVGTCLIMGIAVIVAQVAGYSVGWGFQFQQPLFLVAMATLITLMSLSLFGVFHVQVGTGQGLGKLAQKQGYSGAFFTGVVATILSTPCTAPFLGTAIGFAFSQPWWVILAIFSAVGSGLAAPYMVLSLNPSWMKFLPKPGEWMEKFKEAMGFLLLGSTVWLLWVLGKQVGPEGAIGALAFLLCTSFGAWLINRVGGLEASRTKKVVLWVIALAVAGGSLWLFTWPSLSGNYRTANASQSSSVIPWEPFSKQALDKHLADGKVVFIDFTAEWCQTCKFNEATVLNTQEIKDSLVATNAVVLKADWTNSDPELTATLAKFGRAGVPLYVVFSPHRPTQPTVLPTLLTKQMVIDSLQEAAKP